MKTLKGQQLHESDYADIQRQLEALFYKIIFKPMVDLLSPHNAQVKAAKGELRNAKSDPLVAGINSGKIQYVVDTFSGDFNASISKALRSYGAQFNKRTGTFTILPEMLPIEVLEAAKAYSEAAERLHDDLLSVLDGIQRGLEKSVQDNKIDATVTIGKMNKKFDAAYGDALGTEDLSAESKKHLDKVYVDSLDPYIKNFSDDMVKELRDMVAANAKTGYRFDSLIDRIQNRYSVSKSKAEFLAQQETSLFVSKHREQRFADVGIKKYIWRTAGDADVRKDHGKLNGRTFEYANPPVVDVATGRRANPGEDFRCRCIADPVLPEVFANA